VVNNGYAPEPPVEYMGKCVTIYLSPLCLSSSLFNHAIDLFIITSSTDVIALLLNTNRL